MKQTRFSFVHLPHLLVVCLVVLLPAAGLAQRRTAKAPVATTVPVVMLSDLHFDPFHDPAKFEKLRAAPATEWQKILARPDAPTQEADAAKLLRPCKARGVDTPWTLLESSLTAARTQSPHALFVTASGDLLAHNFDCRFRLLAPGATAAEYNAFAAKTVAYVASELHRVFTSTPVYIALGNNDSGCGDYREDLNSDFLKSTAESFGDTLDSPDAKEDLLKVFPTAGNYSVALPKPIVRGRLIVLQDIFLSSAYVGCSGKRDAAAGDAQLEWLRTELAAAHERNEQVWVMTHIPPGVNLYTTLTHNRDVCKDQAPEMFLRDEALVDVLTSFAADIRLVIFAHTHMDEMRLLRGATTPEVSDADANVSVPRAPLVAAKLVPSVTAINGNYPAFTLAEVDPGSAVLKDYRVISADNKTGIGTHWSEEYRFSTAYSLSAYTPQQLAPLFAKFAADKESRTPPSQAYEENFFVGGGLRSIAIRLVWPSYVCSMRENTVAGFHDCMCPSKP